jgi:hypothetical protein
MSERIDEFAKTVAERTTRRGALMGVGALALGALGILSVSERAETRNSECRQCKRTCRRNNRKPGKKNPNNCARKCRNRCDNT